MKQLKVFLVSLLIFFLSMQVVDISNTKAELIHLKQDPVYNDYLIDNPYYFSNASGTFVIDSISSIPRKITDLKGQISPDDKYIAYTTRRDIDWKVENKLSIYDIDQQKESDVINLDENNIIKFPLNWSTNNSYIVVANEAQASGVEYITIYDLSSKLKVTSFNIFSFFSHWINDSNFVYLTLDRNCNNLCKYSIHVNQYDTKLNNSKVLFQISLGTVFPQVDNMIYIDNKIQLSVLTYEQIPTSYIAIDYKKIASYFTLDLNTGVLSEGHEDDSLSNRLLKKFITDKNFNFKPVIKNKYNKDNYLVEFYSLLENEKNLYKIVNINSLELNEYYSLNI